MRMILNVSTAPIPADEMAAAFVKRPGMFLGAVSYEAAVMFIEHYSWALHDMRCALATTSTVAWDGGVSGVFQRRLKDEGRLRWDSWPHTIAAEAIDWTGQDKPELQALTQQQSRKAICGLEPLLTGLFAEPARIAHETRGEQ